MKTEELKTDVIFRKFKDGGDVIALFPSVAASLEPLEMMSYQHIGQHGGANCLEMTVPAKPIEYADLKTELESIGYVLNIVKRITRKHDEMRVTELQRS